VATTPSITVRSITPPVTVTVKTRGSFLNHTGWHVPPQGTVKATACWPGTTHSRVAVWSHATYSLLTR
jgi:hypothetical protein